MPHSHICAHNHRHSPSDIIAEATAYCAARGLRLTEQRRQILELLAQSPKPLGAYDLLEQIQKSSPKRQAPVVVYRALDFLAQAQLIHRLESRNAFIICPHRHTQDETIVFMICEHCGRVDEAASDMVQNSIEQLAKQRSFQLKSKVIELVGLCLTCKAESACL
jgi:Fur family transcriptional regulator, zinc uptake regulator